MAHPLHAVVSLPQSRGTDKSTNHTTFRIKSRQVMKIATADLATKTCMADA